MNNQLSVVETQSEAMKYNEVFIRGDLSRLTPKERLEYYLTVCHSIGLNPATRPLEYLELGDGKGGKKTVLYARKDCTDQLRALRGVSILRPNVQIDAGLCLVTVDAQDKTGRQDSDVGIVNVGNLQGDFRANAIMKAVTKAKRRVTLSICGLGFLDETEIETIPDARPLMMNMKTGDIVIEEQQEEAKQERSAGMAQDDFAARAAALGFNGISKKAFGELAMLLLKEKPVKWTADVWDRASGMSDAAFGEAIDYHHAQEPPKNLIEVEPADRTAEAMSQ